MANLVFTSAGDHHNVAQWSTSERDYEIFVCYYGSARFENIFPVDYICDEFKGSKFQNLKAVYDLDRTFLSKFSSVFVVDDDIEMSASAINELFAIREGFDLDIVQPSQLGSGKVSFPSLMKFDGCFGRFTNYCEVCVPLFKTEVLISFLEEYDGSLAGWGVDWWYSHRSFRLNTHKIAVIDSISCRNPFESDKGLTIREIDRYQDAASRRADWEKKRVQLGMSTAEGYCENVVVLGELANPAESVQSDEGGKSSRVSVIIEWENVIRADSKNMPVLFSSLRREVEKLGESIELNILFDPGVVDGNQLRQLLTRNELDQCELIDLHVHECSGKHYYELKNEGVLKSTGEIIVFIDSDVDPEEGWLLNLVSYLDQNIDVGMVGGFTYIKPYGIVSKAFAAGWFFPLKPASADMVNSPANFIWSNNCAYRRNIFLAHPYRVSSFNETRGACGRQLVEMQKNGVRTANVSSAVATHPAPNGVRHFITRALAEGRDRVVDFFLANPRASRLSCLKRILLITRGKMQRTVVYSLLERDRLNSTLAEAPILVAVMGCYYSLFVLGALCMLISPALVKDRWRI